MSNRDKANGLNLFLSEPRSFNPPDILEGTRLLSNRYVLKRFLGRGRHAVVFSADDTLRGADVALKIASAQEVEPQIAQEVLIHEGRVYDRIGTHPNVLRVYDLHFDPAIGNGLLFISMELADGGTLSDWIHLHLHEHQYRLNCTKDFLRAMCQAIKPVHDAGVQHLDLSIYNFLFCKGVLKVSDFGAARSFHRMAMASGREAPPLGCSVCTPAYMAPELLYARDPDMVDHRADLFSIGCIAYQIAHPSCQPPFGQNLDEVRYRLFQGPPQPLVGLDEKVSKTIFKCLERVD